MPDITTAIDGLTERLRRYRFYRGLDMPIEIKGLKAKAMVARGHIDRINRAYDKFNEAAPAHAADVEGLADQISQHHEDLSFAANVLGNSTEQSEKQPERLPEVKPEPATFQGGSDDAV